MRVAGLISGTSLDGIDVAVIDIATDAPPNLICFKTIPYPPGVRDLILAISNASTHTAQIARANFLVGELFAAAVCDCGVPLDTIALIGSHGQTIFHEGDPVELLGHGIASTLQIGEPAIIAARTGIPVVADFRTADIAVGGKGAPLVPFVDYLLFRHPAIGRAALNIGGIANITVIPAGAAPHQVIAFDTGPGNMIIDGLTGSYDRNGEIARRGSVDATLLDRLLSDPYYAKFPPKSAGREQYGKEFLAALPRLRLDDLVATLTEVTVETIARAIHSYPDISEVIASGGGVRNLYMMERLRASLRPALKTSADFGIDIDGKEAIAFAILAHETWNRRPSNLPSATGARRSALLGKVCYPPL